MILGAEVALALFGLYAIFKASYNVGKGRKVTGSKARILGVIALTPIPLAFLAGMLVALAFTILGGELPGQIVYTVIEIAILVIVVIVLSVLGKKFCDQQESAKLASPDSDYSQ